VNPVAPSMVPYQRAGGLSPQDQRDLHAYCELLRSYYSVPKHRPLFPALPRRACTKATQNKPSPGAQNRSTHPWRTRVTEGGSR
jgi:hypothetical protein